MEHSLFRELNTGFHFVLFMFLFFAYFSQACFAFRVSASDDAAAGLESAHRTPVDAVEAPERHSVRLLAAANLYPFGHGLSSLAG